MSFAYKKIQSGNITTSPYIANKQFTFNLSNLSGSGVTLYIGENTPLNIINYFDPINDDQTSNNEYKRLIFESIKHLFYYNYIYSGSFNVSSSYYDYPQTTLHSGAFDTNLRYISNITGSSFQGNNSIYNDSIVYDSIYLYDDAVYDGGKGNLISVLSVDNTIYGNNIKPKTFIIEFDNYYIRDDGEGNIFDYINEENYIEIINSGIPTAKYIGNIFYSLGLIVITNQDYVCLFGSPPTTVNDYFSYLNVSQSNNFDITSNDFSDCGDINYSSITLVPLDGYNFPDSYIGLDGFMYIIQNQSSYIPGNYKIGYTIDNINGLQSNLGYIDLEITQQELEINNLDIDKICNGISSNVSYSFDINYGVPIYQYSFDNINYNNIPGFQNITVTGSAPSSASFIYVKDYIGNIKSSSFDAYENPITYTLNILNLPSCHISGGIVSVTSSNATGFTIDSNPTQYNTTSSVYVSTGSHIIGLFNNLCSITSSFSSSNNPQYTYSLSHTDITCFNSGSIIVNNFIGTYSDNITIRVVPPIGTSSLFTTSSLYLENLISGTYSIQTYDGYCPQTSSVIISSFNEMILSSSIDYTKQCMSSIILNVSGGISPYTYQIISPNGVYSSDNNNIDLYYDNLDNIFVTASVTDNNGCVKTIYQEVYGRQYVYSGSYCETN